MRILLSVTIKGDIEYCKNLSKYIKNCLEENNHDVDIIVCSEEDFFSEEEEKIFKLAIENANDYELVIEILLNAAANTRERCEFFYKSTIGKKYATKMQERLAEIFKDCRISKREDFYMLNQTKAPAIILKMFFCTNPTEWKYAVKNKERIAKLIANGISDIQRGV